MNNPNPKLIMEPTIVVQPDAPLPNVNMAQYGNPLGVIGPPSNGPGSGGGIGTGKGGGVGSGSGVGFGPGSGAGTGGGVYRIGGGVSRPELIFKPEPERPMADRTDPWGRMAFKLIDQGTFAGDTTSRDHCIAVYERHNARVKATIPPERLLVYEAGEGWAPLCAFLEVPAPNAPLCSPSGVHFILP